MITRPTLTELITNIIQGIETNTGKSISSTKTNLIQIIAKALAGQIYDTYGNILYSCRQFFPFWAEGEYLENWGALYGVIRQLPVSASGYVKFTGTPATFIPDGTILTRIDGIEYETSAIATLDGSGEAIVSIECLTVGDAGNYPINETLSILSPISGVDTNQTITTAISGGLDLENDESYRDRITSAIQQDVENGKAGDWIIWTKQVAGVLQAWEFPLIVGSGTVGVSFIVVGSNEIPDSIKIDEVKTYLETKAPISFKEIVVLAPSIYTLDLTMSISPDSADNRQAVESAISDYLKTINPSTKESGSKVYVNSLSSLVPGVIINITVPTGDITLDFNQIPRLGAITWA